ncbi:TetR/AcrR family transcriptional regulator [Sporolactobacillus shoreae]|uniref:TetR/AcrR family transcriptional regulator n=1 Tax=Sporolactobacillus shoreae TaxID=1465501 RepID=A0A4Z0GIS7_9BACL|nr:TetR/AcrR family transcriptional regulator [Sporolactobacillus shoreae]TGA96653.1 TetR/AcrR family transcriptional regulator [Sporolactobacillus shoreae]
MEEPKESAILTAAIHEFAEKGFEQASTNQIAKDAGVSKGLVFHYYESKEKLFEESVIYAINFSMEELNYNDWNFKGNVIEKFKKYCEQEIQFCKNYPDLYQLVLAAFTRPPKELTDKIVHLFQKMESLVPEFFQKMIGSLDLKDDVDPATLQAVLQSHYYYYSNRSMGYLKMHPEAQIDELRPFVDQFLAMLSMSLRGLLKNEKDVLNKRSLLKRKIEEN